MGAGKTAVVIEDSDASAAEKTGKIGLVFKSDDGKTHKNQTFVLTRDGSAFGPELRMLLGAVLPNAQAQKDFRELLSYQTTAIRVLESFRGMRVQLELRDGPGYRIDYDAEAGEYVALVDGGRVDEDKSVTSLKAKLEAAGHRRSFREIASIEVLDEQNKNLNLAAFNSVVASIKKSETAKGNPPDVQFAGHTGSTTGK